MDAFEWNKPILEPSNHSCCVIWGTLIKNLFEL